MRILMTGATGLIGKEVGKVLAEKGHELFVVSRSLAKAREILPFPCEVIVGDLNEGPLKDERLKSIEAVINLMGEPIINGRWTEEKKKSIYDSRVIGTRHLVASLPATLKIFASASAIGFYGSCGDEILREDHNPGSDFLAKVCVDWEREAAKAPGRKVYMRTAPVLSRQGGALEQMLFPFRAGVGGVLGDGQQWMSWIHIKDIVGLYVFALENQKAQGPLNGAAPNSVTNKEFSQALAHALGKRLGPSVPHMALKLIFGEAADALLSSVRVSAEKAEALGYKFHFADLSEALDELCAPFKAGEDVFVSEQFVATPPENIFPFFQDAGNLEQFNPPNYDLHVEKVSSTEIKQGTSIDYRLKIHGVPSRWKTEIDEWLPPYKFVDKQKLGPYRFWHHTHEFRPFCGGTLVVDKVRYRLPLGYLGWVLGAKIVKSDVEKIFSFRRKFMANNMSVPRKG
ncbi:TIGR01777 family oxidoreductase [Bdellovibrio bacteriovorus]|uniref:TIGR01777 family oxidoreductase n=1 Tax=Bdellovibrio bacteriovorus TaxID=959 RepID=UPI0035A9A86A